MGSIEAKARRCALECRKVGHSFGSKAVLFDVNLTIGQGEFVSLVGPSGCGKSTLLRGIVGTHIPGLGEILVWRDGAVAPSRVLSPGRDRGIVYQRYSLFPFLNAQKNVAFGLKLDQTSIPFRLLRPFAWWRLRRRHLEEARLMLEKVRLGDALRLYPAEMSGGMQQRVALAQALIMKPSILLLDEPFGALDEATREGLQNLLLDLRSENMAAAAVGLPAPHTVVIVTHELNEAILVGDRVVGLSQYWDWESEGHASCPGATVVYDRLSPIFKPKEGRDFTAFAAQRQEIRDTVFEPKVKPKRVV